MRVMMRERRPAASSGSMTNVEKFDTAISTCIVRIFQT
jgi:hypothetical protein